MSGSVVCIKVEVETYGYKLMGYKLISYYIILLSWLSSEGTENWRLLKEGRNEETSSAVPKESDYKKQWSQMGSETIS